MDFGSIPVDVVIDDAVALRAAHVVPDSLRGKGVIDAQVNRHIPTAATLYLFKGLIQYSDILWNQIPVEAQDAISSDDLACKKYIRRTEERIRIHNGESES